MGVEEQVLDEVTCKLFSWEAPCVPKSKAPKAGSALGSMRKNPSRRSPGDRPQPL